MNQHVSHNSFFRMVGQTPVPPRTRTRTVHTLRGTGPNVWPGDEAIQQGPDCLIATPGRLNDFVQKKNVCRGDRAVG